MRIIAGEFRSRILKAPKGLNTRPTLDKVREAVFSSLGGMFDGGNFLDLYAGSGANGLEALSRGMSFALFNDYDYQAVKCIKENAEALKCSDRCRILKKRANACIAFCEGQYKFDVVYMDPPYVLQRNIEMMRLMDEKKILNRDAWIVIESGWDDLFEAEIEHFRYMRTAEYGSVRITYFLYTGD